MRFVSIDVEGKGIDLSGTTRLRLNAFWGGKERGGELEDRGSGAGRSLRERRERG